MTDFQKRFINELVDNVKKELLTKEIPEDWDGIELRWLIKDRFDRCVIKNTGGRKRKMEYNNYVLVNLTI